MDAIPTPRTREAYEEPARPLPLLNAASERSVQEIEAPRSHKNADNDDRAGPGGNGAGTSLGSGQQERGNRAIRDGQRQDEDEERANARCGRRRGSRRPPRGWMSGRGEGARKP
ncbi:hypothetical protein E2562_032551 [Oryza meyeriana var. granulata]|uniref:Uncharacterized protein n=1 Tax=Oryza meyeriana var. granulata TaxID=110450 RepID=A0A6G1CVP5_9ORYZ|nr:hypothetical protein E2562_032551 [Oryza meyeriana var. granulata]